MSRTDFGAMLRDWRHASGLSQLELATRADVSQRHVSFLETGRSRPSREMVIHLGLALDVPPREQNLLLLAAAHAPEFTETPLDDLEHIAGVLDFILEAHEANIAIVVDRGWNLVRANRAATRFTSILFPDPPTWAAPQLNVMRLNFHPEGIRRHMVDWEPTAAAPAPTAGTRRRLTPTRPEPGTTPRRSPQLSPSRDAPPPAAETRSRRPAGPRHLLHSR